MRAIIRIELRKGRYEFFRANRRANLRTRQLWKGMAATTISWEVEPTSLTDTTKADETEPFSSSH